MKRISSIDIVRGLVMIIMALDHTRDFMHITSVSQSPTNLATTTPALFFTRWITHFCAPVFVFLAGTSAYLSYKRTNDLAASRRFLLTRGAWLILLEFTLVNFGLWFDIRFSVFIFDVIAAIGCGFIVLGLALKATPRILGIAGLLILFFHNLVPLVPFDQHSLAKAMMTALFDPGAFPLTPHTTFIMGYPPVPWLGILLTGFAAGKLFELPPSKRKSIFFKTGLGALALFAMIRFINVYGDPVPWSAQKSGLYTFLSFLNVTKYPPSLQFCLLTFGGMFLALAIAEGVKNRFTAIAEVYGRTPLFYFLVHWYILHPLTFAMIFLQGFKAKDMVFGFNFGRPLTGSGIGLAGVYLVWIAVVVALYPLCRWYGAYKQRHPQNKLLRLL